MKVLVLNSGSSSIKHKLFDMSDASRVLASGLVEKIGEPKGVIKLRLYRAAGEPECTEILRPIADHRAGFKSIVDSLARSGLVNNSADLYGIGHRVVHGGTRFGAPALIDDAVLSAIRETIPLAPLHNPPNLLGIEIGREMFPGAAQVAVFDTAFHQTLPPRAYNYALPREYAASHHVRRFGFHGASYSYVAARAAEYLQRPLEALNLIVLHLGNGASAVAIQNGKSIDTSMGFTPLEGLVMGTRCGDIDPAIHFYLMRRVGLKEAELEHVLNEQSGLKGLCGANDMREIERAAAAGDAAAQLAIEIYCYRIKKYIGAYSAALGRADALVFTAGIGENSAMIRSRSCENLANLGIALDEEKNVRATGPAREIQSSISPVKVLVIATDEEHEIAARTVERIAQRDN